MKRRNFVRNLIGSGTLIGFDRFINSQSDGHPIKVQANASFNLNLAPQLNLFIGHTGHNVKRQIKFLSSQGFKHIEDMGFFSRNRDSQRMIINFLQQADMGMGAFIGHKVDFNRTSLCTRDKTDTNRFLKQIKQAAILAREGRSRWLCVYPGCLKLSYNFTEQRANLIENLKRASEIVEPYGITLLICLADPTLYKDQFLINLESAKAICQEVNSEACKLLFNIYLQQKAEGNLIESISATWNEIGYYQLAGIPGRTEPFVGEINITSLLGFVHTKGFKGIFGLDHGLSQGGIDAEIAVLDAYRRLDLQVSGEVGELQSIKS